MKIFKSGTGIPEHISVLTPEGVETVKAIYREKGLAVVPDSAGYRIFDVAIMRAIEHRYYKTVFFAKRELKKIVKRRIKNRKRFVKSAFRFGCKHRNNQ